MLRNREERVGGVRYHQPRALPGRESVHVDIQIQTPAVYVPAFQQQQFHTTPNLRHGEYAYQYNNGQEQGAFFIFSHHGPPFHRIPAYPSQIISAYVDIFFYLFTEYSML
jgi:hypothetical protein